MSRRTVSAGLLVGLMAAALAPSAGARVLRVGSYKGIPGQYKTIQAAVDAAKPHDWILVGPGDYKTRRGRHPNGADDTPAGILMTTPSVYLRGMNRNTVIVDGTKPGSAVCSRKASAQNLGPQSSKGALGLNGVMVWKANNVWVQNLTVCNFLHGSGDTGNEVWWNGGDGSGMIGGKGYLGSYLNTTSTFFNTEDTAAQYGIFSSNWSGGLWDQTYASNFNDSGYYIGACQQECNQVVKRAHGEYNALGYSGSNSGGLLVVKDSEFDNNEDGFDTNSQNGDNPPPQNGACPPGRKPPVKGAVGCWVFTHNYVHDNNNPNVPAAGSAAAGPVGTGMSVSGGRNDTIINNRFANNNAWGVILVPYPDSGPPCTGGVTNNPVASCLFDEWGDAIINNRFGHNGSYGHPSNGDVGKVNLLGGTPSDCYRGNTEIGGGSVSPDLVALEAAFPTCGAPAPSGASNPNFLIEVLCDSQVSLGSGPPACPTGQYPRRTQVVMHPLPKHGLPTMPRPCAGVPANPWCPSHKGGRKAYH